MLSYYQILQVDESASIDEIKKSYRKLCKIMHPDMHGNTPEANTIFRLLHEAYETLSDPTKRKNYNPKNGMDSSDGFAAGGYDEIINSYKRMVGDYEEIIRLKNRREKDLLNQINQLKQSSKEKKEAQHHQETEGQDHFSNKETIKAKNPDYKTLEIIIWIVFGLIGLTLIWLYVVYPVLMTFLMLLIIFISWIYKTFR